MKKLILCCLVCMIYGTVTFAAYPYTNTEDIDPDVIANARRQELLALQNTLPSTVASSSAPNTKTNTIDPRLTGNETVIDSDDGFLRIKNHNNPDFDMEFKLNIQGNTIIITEKLKDISTYNDDIDTYYTYEVNGESYSLTKRQWYDFLNKMFDTRPQEYWAATLGKVYGDYTRGLGGEYNAQTTLELYIQKVYIPNNIKNWQSYNITGVANNYLLMEESQRRLANEYSIMDKILKNR